MKYDQSKEIIVEADRLAKQLHELYLSVATAGVEKWSQRNLGLPNCVSFETTHVKELDYFFVISARRRVKVSFDIVGDRGVLDCERQLALRQPQSNEMWKILYSHDGVTDVLMDSREINIREEPQIVLLYISATAAALV